MMGNTPSRPHTHTHHIPTTYKAHPSVNKYFFNVIQTPEEKEEGEKDQDRANRTARVQPTPQIRDTTAESPNTPSTDRRK